MSANSIFWTKNRQKLIQQAGKSAEIEFWLKKDCICRKNVYTTLEGILITGGCIWAESLVLL